MELIISVGLLTLVVMGADFVLAFRGDWSGIVRLTLATATYVAILGVLLKSTGRLGAPASVLPVWVFWAAGATGGLVSSLARPGLGVTGALLSIALAPALLASFHWFSLRTWSRVKGRTRR
jgi:hypothetical protein